MEWSAKSYRYLSGEYNFVMQIALAETELPVLLRFDRPMTNAELLRFCEANESLRVERDANGEILVMTPAGFGSSNMNARICRLLDEWAETDGRGTATESSGGYALPDGSVRAPDAAWISFDRLRLLSSEERIGFAPVCPEFVIELRSPSDRLSALEAKMQMWIANGAQVAWMIDPERRVVAIYRKSDSEAGNSAEVLDAPSAVHGSGAVAGFELVMARVWG